MADVSPGPPVAPAPAPLDWCPRRVEGVVTLPVDDQAILWGPAVAVPELLSNVETVIWSFLDGDTSLGAVADDVAIVFHATVDQARADLADLLWTWVDLGVVVPSATEADVEKRGAPLAGPDADRHPLQTPAVLPHPAVAELLRWHRPAKVVVRAGRLTFAVSVESPALHQRVAARLAPVVVDEDGRRRDAILRLRGHTDDPWLVVSDIGLPLLLTEHPIEAIDLVARRVGEVIDRASAEGVAWFRFAAVALGGPSAPGDVVLLQHELLVALPDLTRGLAAAGLHLWPTDHVAVDPGTAELVRHAGRFPAGAQAGAQADADADPQGPPIVAGRHRIRGIVLVGGEELGPTPASLVERRWLLALYACIGHDPRRDDWQARWDAVVALDAVPLEVVASFAPADALAGIQAVLAAD